MTQENHNGQPLAFGAAMLKAASMLNVHPAFMQGAIERTDFLANALRIGLASGVVRPMWKPHITIMVGGNTVEELIVRMEKAGFKDKRIFEMIRRPEFRPTSVARKMRLIVITPRNIGFSEDEKMKVVLERAGQFGLQICPDDVAIELQVGYAVSVHGDVDWRSLTSDSYIVTAMDPHWDGDLQNGGHKAVFSFCVSENNDLKHLGSSDCSKGLAYVDQGLIFVLP